MQAILIATGFAVPQVVAVEVGQLAALAVRFRAHERSGVGALVLCIKLTSTSRPPHPGTDGYEIRMS